MFVWHNILVLPRELAGRGGSTHGLPAAVRYLCRWRLCSGWLKEKLEKRKKKKREHQRSVRKQRAEDGDEDGRID